MVKYYTKKLLFYQIICILIFAIYGCSTSNEPTNGNNDVIELQPIIMDQTLWQQHVVTAPNKYSIEKIEMNGDYF